MNEIAQLKRQLALAVKSNERLRAELNQLRPECRRLKKLLGKRAADARYQEKQRAEMWKHRALNR